MHAYFADTDSFSSCANIPTDKFFREKSLFFRFGTNNANVFDRML